MPDLVTATLPATDGSYVVSCWKCGEKFSATSALWCGCNEKLRTLKCPTCGSCFCGAPFAYKRRFWADSPKALRENPQRFCIVTPKAGASGADESRSPEAGSLPRPHVLVVDDDEAMRSLATCYVEQMGYRVTTIESAEEALKMVDTLAFDVVLTDALMPKMDGRELCRRVKAAHGNEIKVVLMTSLYTASHYRTEAKNVYKVDEYLAKPLRYAELRDALQRVAPLALSPAERNEAHAG